MKVKFFGVGQEPCYKDIDNTLEAMQSLVNGYIEMVFIGNDNCIVCNEEGRINGMPYNRICEGYDIYGDFFVVGVDDEGDCTDIHE